MTTRKDGRKKRSDRSTSMPVPSPPAGTSGAGAETRDARHAHAIMASGRESVRRNVLAGLALATLVIVSYLPAMLWGSFVWDDRIWTGAEAVREWSGLWRIWLSPAEIENESHYWPLVYTTFWLEHKLWGFAPIGYHVVNVLLHLANTFLLWHLMRRLTVPGAWLVAAVFAVHPLHVESVAWVMERKDVLSALFYLAAVLVWLRFVEEPRLGRYLLALALFVLGLLAKSIVITLPMALLIWHWWKKGRVTWNDLFRLTPFFLVGLGIAVADVSYTLSRSVRDPTLFDYSLLERVLIAARALWFYVGKLLWPVDLAVIYPRWEIDVADPLAWGYVIAACAVAALLWLARHRIGRGSPAGALFFAVTLSPVLGFVDYNYMQYSFVADRYQYLAGIGVIAILIGAAVHGVAMARNTGRLSDLSVKGLQALAISVLGIFAALTWQQAGIYQDVVTFNRHIVALNPQARFAHVNLSKGLFDQGRLDEALVAAQTAVEKGKVPMEAHVALGVTLISLERHDEGETHLRRALEIDPHNRHALQNLAVLLIRQERYEEAVTPALAVLKRHPDSFEVHSTVGLAFSKLGRLDEAEQHLRRAVALNSHDTSTRQNLAESLRRRGRYEEALEWYDTVIRIDPKMALAHAGKGDSLFNLKRYDEAIESMNRAVALQPGSPMAARLNFLMGQAAQELDQLSTATEYYERVLQIDAHHFEALDRLAWLHFAEQRYGDALGLYQTLVGVAPGNAQVLANLGAVLFQLDRPDEALRSYERALSLDPALEEARVNRDRLLQSLQRNAAPGRQP